jgi:hypothetical protein
MTATSVLSNEISIRKLSLRILVETLAVGVGRRGIEIVVEFLDVLSMVPLRAGETKEAFLEDRILSIPESEAKTESSESITQPQKPILSPAVDTTAGLVKGEGVPDIAVCGVIFPYCPPLAL